MNPKFSQKVLVGAFVIMGLAIFIAVIFILGGGEYLFKSSYSLKTKFNDVSGLRLGSAVFLNGYNIGKVNKIELSDQANDRQFTITLDLLSDYKERIRADSFSKIDTQGLLGDKAVSISVGSSDQRRLEAGEFLPVKQNVSLNDVAERGVKVIDQVEQIISSVGGIIEDVKTKKSMVNALLYDPQGSKVVADLGAVTSSAQKLLSNFEKENLPNKFSASAKNLQSMTQNLNQMSAKIAKGEGSIGGLINDPTVYYDLKTLLGKANRSMLIKAVIRHTMSQNEKQTLK